MGKTQMLLLAALAIPLLAARSASIAWDILGDNHKDDAPCYTVLVDRGALLPTCSGCGAALVPDATNDQMIECADGTLGGSIVISESSNTSTGLCQEYLLRNPPRECRLSGSCSWSLNAEILFAQNTA